MKETLARSIYKYLFAEAGKHVFVILDGASVPQLLAKLEIQRPDYFCLYRGELTPDMAAVAPYLVELRPETPFTDWIIARGWGNHWGIFALSVADLRTMRAHLRTFLTVYDMEGKPLLFRYYDPRVLRLYLPTCNAQELQVVFGPVESYLLEDEDSQTMLSFKFVEGLLQLKKLPLEQSAPMAYAFDGKAETVN